MFLSATKLWAVILPILKMLLYIVCAIAVTLTVLCLAAVYFLPFLNVGDALAASQPSSNMSIEIRHTFVSFILQTCFLPGYACHEHLMIHKWCQCFLSMESYASH